MREKPLRIDLHIHTEFSHDSKTTLREAVKYAKKRSLDGIAICDHNTIKGALKLAERVKEFVVIIGEEVSTSNGHILALNIVNPIPKGLTPYETVELIHEEGGLAVMAHPVTPIKGTSWRRLNPKTSYDAVEVINSNSFPFFISKLLAERYAERRRIPKVAGSDSHLPWTIGKAYTEVESTPEVESILKAIKANQVVPCGGPLSPIERIRTLCQKPRKNREEVLFKRRIALVDQVLDLP